MSSVLQEEKTRPPAVRKGPMDCVSTVDDAFSQHLAVSLASLLFNNAGEEIRLHVVHNGLLPVNMRKLKDTVMAFPNAEIAFYRINSDGFADFPVDGHINLATYFRLFLAEILPEDLDRVLYLDADIVVTGNVRTLFDTDFSGSALVAVADPFLSGTGPRLGLPRDHVYFNAGVLLIDLKLWRRDNVLRAFFDVVARRRAELRFLDQDVLNIVFADRTRCADYIWNFQARTQARDLAGSPYHAADYSRLRRQARIIHFTTKRKPWNFRDAVPFEKQYLAYLKKTAWRDARQNGKTVRNAVLRYTGEPGMRLRRLLRRLKTISGRTQLE